MTHKRPGLWVLYPIITLTVFFVIPFSIMLMISFFRQSSGGFYEQAFVFDNYIRFLSPFFGKVMLVSVGLSALAALCAVAVAFPFTYFITRMSQKAQSVILVFLLSVLSLSEVIIGFSWSTLLSQTAGIGNILAWLGIIDHSRSFAPSFGGLLTSLVYLGFPYAVLVIYPPLSRLDPELPEAAQLCGASPLRSFWNIIIPMMRNTITGALILVFVFTLGAYVLPQILGRPEHWTLSVHITDQALFQSNLPFAAAMAMFLLLVSLALVGLSMLMGQKDIK